MKPKQVIGLCQYVSRLAGNLFSAFTYPISLAYSWCFGSRKAQALKAEATKPQINNQPKLVDALDLADNKTASLKQREAAEVVKPARRLSTPARVELPAQNTEAPNKDNEELLLLDIPAVPPKTENPNMKPEPQPNADDELKLLEALDLNGEEKPKAPTPVKLARSMSLPKDVSLLEVDVITKQVEEIENEEATLQAPPASPVPTTNPVAVETLLEEKKPTGEDIQKQKLAEYYKDWGIKEPSKKEERKANLKSEEQAERAYREKLARQNVPAEEEADPPLEPESEFPLSHSEIMARIRKGMKKRSKAITQESVLEAMPVNILTPEASPVSLKPQPDTEETTHNATIKVQAKEDVSPETVCVVTPTRISPVPASQCETKPVEAKVTVEDPLAIMKELMKRIAEQAELMKEQERLRELNRPKIKLSEEQQIQFLREENQRLAKLQRAERNQDSRKPSVISTPSPVENTVDDPSLSLPKSVILPPVIEPTSECSSSDDSDDEDVYKNSPSDSLQKSLPNLTMSLPVYNQKFSQIQTTPLTQSLNSAVCAIPLRKPPQLSVKDLDDDDFKEMGLEADEVETHLSILNKDPKVIDHLLSLVPEGDEPVDEKSLENMVNSLPTKTVSQIKELLPQTTDEVQNIEANLPSIHQPPGMSLKFTRQLPPSIYEGCSDEEMEEYIDDVISSSGNDDSYSSDEDGHSVKKEVSPGASLAKADTELHRSDMEKKLNVHNTTSKLSKILKSATGVPEDEHPEVARAVAARLNGASCTSEELRQHVTAVLTSHVSRTQKLAPSLVEAIRRQPGTISHLPFRRCDIDQMDDAAIVPSEKERQAVKDFAPLLDETQNLIFRPVLGANSGSYAGQIAEVEKAISELHDMQLKLENPEDLTYYVMPGEKGHNDDSWDQPIRNAVHQDIMAMKGQLEEKKEQLEIIQRNDPRTVENLMAQASKWSQAAHEAIDNGRTAYDQKIEKASKASKRILRGAMILVRKKLENERPDFDSAKEQVTGMVTALNGEYQGQGGELPTMIQDLDAYVKGLEKICKEVKSKDYLESQIVDMMENQSPPKKSVHELPLIIEGKLYKYTVEYTPMREMLLRAEGPAPQGDCNPLALTGFTPSQNRDSEHAQNLTCVVVKDPDGEVIRRELRVGSLVPIPKRIKKRKDRDAIAEKRMNEALVGLVTNNQANIPGLAEALQGRQEDPIELPFTYLCFLSPDKLRHKTGFHEDEYLMAKEASEMLEKLEGKEKELEFLDSRGVSHKVRFKFKPRMYIFPVNQLAFSKLRHLARPFELTDRLNKKAMEGLIGATEDKQGMPGGDAGEFIHSAHWELLSGLEKENFLALCKEHRRSIESKSYHHGGTRAFYDIWLVDQICQIMHAPLMGGCKSAKDRTNNVYKSNVVDCCEADVRMKTAREVEEARKSSHEQDDDTSSKKTSPTDRLTLMPHMTTEERIQNQTVAHVVYGGLQQQNNNCGKYGYKVEDTTLAEVDPYTYQLTMVK
ncbi:hypothetical protein M3P05_03705 [Sansalvadorimonas sp. 2012CJ34-2]|uniref:Uncharacterized protein n=1 Tax=Parendozoicomonas callyspongiae TaxID=2942213 RepID=A0ABT0PCR2_9GAMM|nr:inositol phosphate phosphatase SopB [Sansalvadorimonas sp. 2012CJ34-2]MCL6269046.1 hypothetical protein [Sansalvadorimonas sp. 2012CJ34-2]